MAITVVGSLNVDLVYRVSRIVQPGETLGATDRTVHAGGKGANQSMALARAGASVRHVGCVGPEGEWLRDLLAEADIDVTGVRSVQTPTGHAIIQVDAAGENAIVLYPGANHDLTAADIDRALATAEPGSWLLTQHETTCVADLLAAGGKGFRVCFNPAPFSPAVLDLPLVHVALLVLNETEAVGLTGCDAEAEPATLLAAAARRCPNADIVLTRGSRGVNWKLRTSPAVEHRSACRVTAVDTTAAGDTFIGYLLADLAAGRTMAQAIDLATRAAAICVTQPGAIPSIPTRAQVDAAG